MVTTHYQQPRETHAPTAGRQDLEAGESKTECPDRHPAMAEDPPSSDLPRHGRAWCVVVGDGTCLQLYMLKGWHGHAGNKWQNIRFPAHEHRLLAQMRHVQGGGREGLALH